MGQTLNIGSWVTFRKMSQVKKNQSNKIKWVTLGKLITPENYWSHLGNGLTLKYGSHLESRSSREKC